MQQGVKYTMQKKALGTSLRAGVDDVRAKDYQQLRAETDVTSIEMRRDCTVSVSMRGAPDSFGLDGACPLPFALYNSSPAIRSRMIPKMLHTKQFNGNSLRPTCCEAQGVDTESWNSEERESMEKRFAIDAPSLHTFLLLSFSKASLGRADPSSTTTSRSLLFPAMWMRRTRTTV